GYCPLTAKGVLALRDKRRELAVSRRCPSIRLALSLPTWTKEGAVSESNPGGATPALERRLATILSADVAGYSKMMGATEEAPVQALRGHRAVFDALLKQHRGRVFNTAGDAILAEFPSAVDAVRCATEIQTALQTRNEHLPAEQKLQFRMGINLGDVVVQDDGDLLGDGVNVASRIQTVAERGGVWLPGRRCE